MADYLEIHELYHHGIEGQKWGVRRYQNEDGSLTEAGKRRYYVDSEGKMSDVGYEKLKKDIKEDTKAKIPVLSGIGKAAVVGSSMFVGSIMLRNIGNLAGKNQPVVRELFNRASMATFLSIPLVQGLTAKSGMKEGFDLRKRKNIESKNFKQKNDELAHHGIEGQKWGVRRYQNEDGTLTEEGKARYAKMDDHWVKTKSEKIYKKAYRESSDEMREYLKNEMKGETGKTAINKFNKKLAEVMRTKTSNLRSPSGRVVEWVAKRGHVGVYMALADPGFDMSTLKSGVWESGRIAYKKSKVDMQ